MDQQPEKRKYVGPTVGPSPAPVEPEDASSKRRRVIGPSLPPPAQTSASDDDNNNNTHKPSATATDSNSDSDSSDDDDFGPTLPPPAGSAQPTQPPPPTSTSTSTSTTSKPTQPTRDAWMLEPLEPSDRTARVDPTRLKNRRFQSGPRAGNASASGGGVDVTWTETPDQKMKRLQDEVLGVQAPRNHDSGAGGGGGGGAGAKQTQPSKAMQEKIQRYNEEKRREDAAAREKHKKAHKEEEDDPSKRAFDREKDMGLAGKISHAQRREMMSKAADFGSRFSSGKFL
ncbi:GPALPP motifs-containing protein 1 [Aspergillus aculeatinus CBS 121060]|uniref:Uncharacterized protein n=1 Tax=Aspergillus aculeatinus CBS 121060 TaxID=1448322 RepID=A0ACD1H6U3_9EURO|nr:hypothetical protein BO66DRAFT_376327 [Aspergillus aculeatinus CBS 121060]RAH69175.1 hypothetical protein BO66DRAFT_376327 [Aspergillus aculeatinus CBS 121060]